tara:strand:- start:40628 stop:41476 length:849 start_codon:yes stop_codon:yes gene_type:complete
MKVLKTKKDLKTYFQDSNYLEAKIGLIPTMGALHQGHLSLVEESKRNTQVTVASIFVNPTQFDKKEDLEKYPKTIENDLKLLEQAGCDIVFIPSVEEIYNKSVISDHFDFDGLENEMEGRYRSGHFDGVGTIVKAFIEIVSPTHAYFGEKDFQQLQVIKKMVEKKRLNVKIIGCPIYREENGLAMSSRNERLSSEQRNEATLIYKTLTAVKEKSTTDSIEEITNWVKSQFKDHPLFELEYFAIADEVTLKNASTFFSEKKYRAFIAVFAGSVRLIDNISLYS